MRDLSGISSANEIAELLQRVRTLEVENLSLKSEVKRLTGYMETATAYDDDERCGGFEYWR